MVERAERSCGCCCRALKVLSCHCFLAVCPLCDVCATCAVHVVRAMCAVPCRATCMTQPAPMHTGFTSPCTPFRTQAATWGPGDSGVSAERVIPSCVSDNKRFGARAYTSHCLSRRGCTSIAADALEKSAAVSLSKRTGRLVAVCMPLTVPDSLLLLDVACSGSVVLNTCGSSDLW